MGPEKPPRRSKPKPEPAVIDLEAADASSETRPEPSDDKAVAEALTELPDAVSAEAPVTAEEAAAAAADNDGVDTSELPAPPEPKPAEDEKPEEIGTAEALAAEPPPAEPLNAGPPTETEPEEPAAVAPAPVERRSGASVGTALAAGIFGGLVVLAGAGGLQYAGYLPSLGAPAPAPAAPAADTSAIEADIAALKGEIATLAARPDAPATDTSALEARIAALEARPEATDGAPVDLAPLEQRIEALGGELARLQGALADAAERQRSIQTDLVDRLQKVEADVNDPARRNAVARAIAASGLKAAIDRGGAFLPELETFAGVTGEDPAVAGLTPYAETGVPTRAALAAGFPEAASAVLAALDKPDPDQGVAARLWSSALSLVKVRPVGQVEGDTPEAFVARAEEALKNGDLDAALAEWNRLPEEGRAAAPDFGKALAARIEVDRLVGATLRDAVAGASAN